MAKINTRFLLASAGVVALAIAALGSASPASAQTPDGAASADGAAPDAGPASGATDIIITGSRISNGNSAPVPVTVVNAEALREIQPGSIAQAVATLPAFAGGVTFGYSTSGTNLTLRFLGPERTLVLFDGNRVGPTTYDQLVDADTIPQMLLQRVDVVTGGVSAVYGSDAVAGVVNFVTDNHFNGQKARVQYGLSSRGDAGAGEIGYAFGSNILGDRGHFEASAQYMKDDGLAHRSARGWGRLRVGQFGLGTAASPYHTVYDSRVSSSSFGGKITGATGAGSALNNMIFDDKGALSPFINGVATGTNNIQSGGSGAYNDASAKPLTETGQLFARFDFDVSSDVSFFIEGGYDRTKIRAYENYQRFNNLKMSGMNAFLNPAYQFDGTFNLSKFDTQLPISNFQSDTRNYFIMTGLKGKLEGWNWNVSLNRSRSKTRNSISSQIDLGKFYAATDAVAGGGGNVVCRVTLTNPDLYPGCVPYNLFGTASASQAAMDYVVTPSYFDATNGMTDLTASVSGSPFSLWAGPVDVAFSAEWRQNSLKVVSNAHPDDYLDCTGLSYNCSGTTTPRWMDDTVQDLPKVSKSVWEAGIETDIPLLKDVPLIRSLSLNGAVRYIDYQTTGPATSWKVGLDWKVNSEIRFRATRSRDIRAPNLYELYQPSTVSLVSVSDRLLNTSGNSVLRTASGNPDLKPEIARTTTVGMVYTPEWLRGFSLAVDYFNINIKDAMLDATGSDSDIQDLCYASGGTSVLCSLQTRANGNFDADPSNVPTAFYERLLNVASTRTYGIDFEANYHNDLFGNPLSLRALVTWQPHAKLTIPGPITIDAAGLVFSSALPSPAPLPKVRATAYAEYEIGDFKINFRERFRSAMSNANSPDRVYADYKVDPSFYTDATFTYRFKGVGSSAMELYLNVQNLFDAQPFPVGRTSPNIVGARAGYVPGDDIIGRYFTVGARIAM